MPLPSVRLENQAAAGRQPLSHNYNSKPIAT
jgi:hypothetical protein